MNRWLMICALTTALTAIARVDSDKGSWLESGETLACFGDSITALPGYYDILSNRLARVGIKVVNVGRGGDNSATALMRIDEVVAKKPDAVMIFFGTNDSAAGRGRWVGEPSIEPDTYRDNVLWMIHYLRQKGVKKFSVVTTAGRIEGEGYREFGKRRDLYNLMTRQIAERSGARLVPLDIVFDAAREERKADAYGRIFTKDDVHLTSEGSALAAETMLKTWRMLPPPSDSIILSNRFGTAEISRVGAQVVSYVPAGQQETLFMPADRDFSRNRQMHGGIPVCWPWFGRYGDPGSRIHGIVRYCTWQVESVENSEDRSRAVLTLASDAQTRKAWPHDFRLRYEIELTDRLSLSLAASNTGDRPFSTTEGFHPYFRVTDPSAVTVFGPPNPVRVYPGIDGGHPVPSGGTYRFDTGDGQLTVTSKGERKLVVWNPGPDWKDWKPDCNMARDDWQRFVCVEPAIIGRENAVVLNPGESHIFEMTIKKESK